MLRINEITRGRMGNKILHYNTLAQLGASKKQDVSCNVWEDQRFFTNTITHKSPENPETKLSWREILTNPTMSFRKDIDYEVDEYAIHNVFWRVTKQDPRDFLQISDQYKKKLRDDVITVGIHFRGTDILGGDGNGGREIHSPEYYKNAIDFVRDHYSQTHFYLCTDDMSFISFRETIDYLQRENLSFSLGSPDKYDDFSTLAECDVLIASSSTFVVCAGFLGKKNKKIIHSKEWINKNVEHTLWHPTDPPDVREWQLSFDEFWVELYRTGGNKFYELWSVV